jgi:hypothetical protein
MEKILENLGLSPIMILVVIVLVFLAKEIWSIIRTSRSKLQQDIIGQIIQKIDTQLEDFYLPLASRLKVSKNINIILQNLRNEGKLENDKLNIKSNNKNALRDIVVRKIYFPLNIEMEKIVLGKSFLSTTEDETDYSKIITHFILWRNLEQSIIDGEIEKYSAEGFLSFPSKEVETFFEVVEKLVKHRNMLRLKLLKYQSGLTQIKKHIND